MVYSKGDNLNGGNAKESPNKKHKYSGGRCIYLPNLICAPANSSRPRRKPTSLNGSGLREEAPTQGKEIGEYSLQSLHGGRVRTLQSGIKGDALEFCKGYLPRREPMQLEWLFSSA